MRSREGVDPRCGGVRKKPQQPRSGERPMGFARAKSTLFGPRLNLWEPHQGALRQGEVVIPALIGDLQERVPPNASHSDGVTSNGGPVLRTAHALRLCGTCVVWTAPGSAGDPDHWKW